MKYKIFKKDFGEPYFILDKLQESKLPDPETPNTPELVAHDLVEHVNGIKHIGTIEDELEALGAAYLTRYIWDEISLDGLRHDTISLFDYFQSTNRLLKSPRANKRSRIIDSRSLECWLDPIRKKLSKDEHPVMVEHFMSAAENLIQRGASKLLNKYDNAVHANMLFNNIVTALKESEEYPIVEFNLVIRHYKAHIESPYIKELL